MRSCSSTIRRRVRAFGAAIGAGEEVVFVTGLDRPDGALDGIDQFKHVGTPKTLGRLRVGRRLAELSGKQHDTETPTHRPQKFLEAGGLAGLTGTSGGRAERGERMRQRRTVKTEHHALLGSYFLTHPSSIRSASGSTRILLTADYGPSAVSPGTVTLYASDTSLKPHGSTRVLRYTRARSATAT